MKRRDFLQIGAACVAANSVAISIGREPISRSGPARFQVGLAAYSLRDYFSYKKGKDQKPKSDGKPIDMIGFCLLYTSPSPRDQRGSRMPSSA